ncbi:MAG TPA: SurA N-terminal domain-containing protein [Anaerolineae bacterium]|nr:SurA N-terminal domain-containing protein [Anaerolineae bacterium]
MSKNKINPKVQVPTEPTRKQLSRAEREARQRRRINLAVGGVLLLVVAIIVGGFLYENISAQVRLSQPVANVNGELISTTEFQDRVRLVRAQLNDQANFYANTLNDTQTAQQIQSRLSDPVTLGGQVINSMVDEILLKQAASQYNVSVTPDDIEAKIEETFGYQRNPPTPAPTRTPLPTPTASAEVTQTATPLPTPLPTSTPISKESALQSYQDYLKAVGMTDAAYRKYVEMNLYSDKIRAALGSTVPTTTEQIQFKFIGILDAATVPTVTEALNKDGFMSVYQAILSNTLPYSSSVVAQDVNQWVPTSIISSELGSAAAEAFFSTPISQTTAIVSNTTSAGVYNYVGLIEAKGVEPLSATYLQQDQNAAVEAWLQQRRNPAFLLTWADRVPTKP